MNVLLMADMFVALDGVNKTLDQLLLSMQNFEDIRDETANNFSRAEELAVNTSLNPVVTQLANMTDLIVRLTIQSVSELHILLIY